jgi:hypothetical protein
MRTSSRLAASFRDPSGFLFTRDGQLYRQVNQLYQPDYERLMASGLYARLVKNGRLIAHQEVDVPAEEPEQAYRVIQPERVAFISYPYEWSFSQLKDAALLTLSIQKSALKADLSLKDASAYNIQFQRGKPVLIDTLSFEIYQEGQPWVAYRQFCQHFLAPLALMAYRDVRLSQLLRVYIDGVPLDLASSLLPFGARLNPGLLMHIFLHAGAQKKYAQSDDETAAKPPVIQPNGAARQGSRAGGMSRAALVGLIESLEGAMRKLSWNPAGTEWGSYYEATNYTDRAFESKAAAIKELLAAIQPRLVWDLGANTGVFSRLSADQGFQTISFDIDPVAVEKNYLQVKRAEETALLPLVLDLTNPSPAIGWKNEERSAWVERGPADLILALALVHHLAISNNVPLSDVAALFAQLGKHLVIEFVPKEDSQVRRLLATRKDIFPNYTRAGFEDAFQHYFLIRDTRLVDDSERVLYWMESK